MLDPVNISIAMALVSMITPRCLHCSTADVLFVALRRCVTGGNILTWIMTISLVMFADCFATIAISV